MRTPIRPVTEWFNYRYDEGCYELVDPSGTPYNPYRPPACIENDPLLGPALSVTAKQASAARITVISGLQQDATDLGPPGTFEALIADAQLFGHDSTAPGFDEYTDHLLEVSRRAMRAGTIRIFDVTDSGADAETQTYIRLLNREGGSLTARTWVVDTEMDPREYGKLQATREVALTHAQNAEEWNIVAGAIRRLEQSSKAGVHSDEQHLLISINTRHIDVARKFGVLGIANRLITPNKDIWPPYVTSNIKMHTTMLMSGRLSLDLD